MKLILKGKALGKSQEEIESYVNLHAEESNPYGAECGSVLAIYLVPTRKTPPACVDAETNTCTDFYTDGANLLFLLV